MLVIVNKKLNSNQWDYPDDLKLFKKGFSNPIDRTQLVVDYIGNKTLLEMNLTEYVGIVQENNEDSYLDIKDFLLTLPISTRRLVANIRDTADYADPLQAANGDTANLLLALIDSGNSINVYGEEFEPLMTWLTNNTDTTIEDVVKLKDKAKPKDVKIK